jgi:hypothetical protein
VRVRRFLHILLFLIAGLVMWKIGATWRRPLEEAPSSTQQNVTEEKSLPPLQLPTPQVGKRYAEVITDKDLFIPSRSRAAKDNAPVVTVPPPSHLRLVGVLRAADREEVFFSDATQGGKVVRVRKGELVGSYRLVSVAPLQATLSLGQDGDEVSLPLLVLDSGTAGQAQRLMSQAMRGSPGRPGQPPVRPGMPAGRPSVTPPAAEAPQTETHAIRQNIQQLQQRLRQLRKQASRNGDDEEDEEDEGDEDEEEE